MNIKCDANACNATKLELPHPQYHLDLRFKSTLTHTTSWRKVLKHKQHANAHILVHEPYLQPCEPHSHGAIPYLNTILKSSKIILAPCTSSP